MKKPSKKKYKRSKRTDCVEEPLRVEATGDPPSDMNPSSAEEGGLKRLLDVEDYQAAGEAADDLHALAIAIDARVPANDPCTCQLISLMRRRAADLKSALYLP